MEKYKRPKKYPGIRSIPLRNRQRVLSFTKWDTDEAMWRSVFNQPIEGVTDTCFTKAGVDSHEISDPFLSKKLPSFMVEEWKRVTLLDNLLEQTRYVLVYKSTECYIEHMFFAIGVKYISRMYPSTKEAKEKLKRGPIRWVRYEPIVRG